ncbi:hypothetical protein DVH24_033002 [Malus domestica]|uniref:Uncharacterized protein n=1 Tax=Malus domestica TaxID=3750 RepID=A0A498IMD8_MALDO|nr:hypothetical protein DVH24_033002 [Malus domestica]
MCVHLLQIVLCESESYWFIGFIFDASAHHLQPQNVCFEHVGFGGLLPVDCSVHKSRFSREKSGNVESDEDEGNGKSLKGSHKLRENLSKMLLPC